jgi:DNA polymerase-3 subunit chi
MAADAEKVAEFIELRSPDDRLPEACARTQLHYERGRTVAVYVPEPGIATELDHVLWIFRQNAFIPHVRLEKAEGPVIEPVIIFSGHAPDLQADVLIVLTDGDLPAGFERFPHVCDFAEVYDPARRQASRQRYTACQSAGYRMRFVKP